MNAPMLGSKTADKAAEICTLRSLSKRFNPHRALLSRGPYPVLPAHLGLLQGLPVDWAAAVNIVLAETSCFAVLRSR